jgi:hypothetical protein
LLLLVFLMEIWCGACASTVEEHTPTA